MSLELHLNTYVFLHTHVSLDMHVPDAYVLYSCGSHNQPSKCITHIKTTRSDWLLINTISLFLFVKYVDFYVIYLEIYPSSDDYAYWPDGSRSLPVACETTLSKTTGRMFIVSTMMQADAHFAAGDGKSMAHRFAPSDEGCSESVRLSMSVSGPDRGDITILRFKKKSTKLYYFWSKAEETRHKKKSPDVFGHRNEYWCDFSAYPSENFCLNGCVIHNGEKLGRRTRNLSYVSMWCS